MRAIRGAITVKNNTEEDIKDASQVLINKMLKENAVKKGEIVSIVFTATEDLDQLYPAAAIREIGFTYIPLMCYQEMKVENSLNKCIRAMIYITKNIELDKIRHVYLKKAKSLREDLIC